MIQRIRSFTKALVLQNQVRKVCHFPSISLLFHLLSSHFFVLVFLLILNSSHKAQLTLYGLPSFSQHSHKRVQERWKIKRAEPVRKQK